jgi:protein-tyrosine phosphatase
MRLLFICHGNICRSPMAEAFMRRECGRRPTLRGVDVGSFGVRAADGRPPTELTIDVMNTEHGLDLTSHRARQLDASVTGDLLLTVDRPTLGLVRESDLAMDMAVLGEYVGVSEDVKDPYGRDRGVYCDCARHILRLIELLADRLESARAGASA